MTIVRNKTYVNKQENFLRRHCIFPRLFTNKKRRIGAQAQSHVRTRLRSASATTKQFPTGIDHARPAKSQLLAMAYLPQCFMQIADNVPYQALFIIISLFVNI